MSGPPYPPLRGDEPCRKGDPERFFPTPETRYRTRQTVAECQPCPVREECLAWALAYGEPGIWGGTTEPQRRRMRRQLGIRAVPVVPIVVDREQAARMADRHTPRQVIAEVLGVQPTWISRVLREHRQQQETEAS